MHSHCWKKINDCINSICISDLCLHVEWTLWLCLLLLYAFIESLTTRGSVWSWVTEKVYFFSSFKSVNLFVVLLPDISEKTMQEQLLLIIIQCVKLCS